MGIELRSGAERRAQEAERLEAFSGLNLIHIKRGVAELLRHIGEQGIFETYTRHDIEHIDSMLAMVDWVIPVETASLLTPADWLMIVLSIYFHDMGMLATRDEYQSRDLSGFHSFRETHLLTDDREGLDYATRLQELELDERERFLYQEFLRATHAGRVRRWIDGRVGSSLGVTEAQTSIVADLLSSLSDTFRRDLGLVCESHHLQDLDDVNKYKIDRPYGNAPEEQANLQYAAIVLRTVDLLQITRDRTPSIAYRVLNPADPLSQEEWAKQMAVVAVKPQLARDRDGRVDRSIQSSTVVVDAYFTKEEGFFGLTHYLTYATAQLEQSYKWGEESFQNNGSRFKFPWRDIDQSQIKTEGFLPHQYSFSIDKEKILDLLTGHTLYNDTSVVVRELTQNAIDAVRLQYSLPKGELDPNSRGTVHVSWDSASRVLQVRDDGTGMTQQIIERNLLRVGSSRYQEENFRNEYPSFNPISRFGIGVLSAFMIADAVEVITSHLAEPEARQISLRDVHGRYLIRLLRKDSDEISSVLGPHGTIVRLKVRGSAEMGDVRELVKGWFLLPKCKLTVSIDGGPPEQVGFNSLQEAVEEDLEAIVTERRNAGGRLPGDKFEVRSVSIGGVEMAFAVRWSPYFRSWEFLAASSLYRVRKFRSAGVCVEGVRVEKYSPGYSGLHVLAAANATGPSAPRTNVARSSLEETQEYRNLLATIYRIYLGHIEREISDLQRREQYSMSRAVWEASYLLRQITTTGKEYRISDENVFEEEFLRLPILIVEHEGDRRIVSLEQLAENEHYYTVDDPLIRNAERVIREFPTSVSLTSLLQQMTSIDLDLPDGPLMLSEVTGPAESIISKRWEVTRISVYPERPRIVAEWGRRAEGTGRWIDVHGHSSKRPDHFEVDLIFDELDFGVVDGSRPLRRSILIPASDVPVTGLDDFDGVIVDGFTYLRPSGRWSRCFRASKSGALSSATIEQVIIVCRVISDLGRKAMESSEDWLRRTRASLDKTDDVDEVDWPELEALKVSGGLALYSMANYRRDGSD